ncbi:MAG TPA: patatin-like phospholipase family protein [Polyangia bacterium]|nr:patatin-like phospholipase family protein [Polyangia bacterium]
MTSLSDLLRREPFELILSSGFFGFFAHAGVVQALEEAALVPSLVGGSSAGALVTGLWGAGLPAALIRERLFALERRDFWDPDPLFGLAKRRVGFLRGDRFERLLTDALEPIGVRTFAECKLRVRLVAFDVAARKTVTLESGELAPAIRASCSVPGMFQPVQIASRHYLDGGIADRAGIAAASDGAVVLYHHLPTHSPWRRFTPGLNRVPSRPRLHVLHEPALPRLSPFHLDRGPRAFDLARDMTLRALAAAAAS